MVNSKHVYSLYHRVKIARTLTLINYPRSQDLSDCFSGSVVGRRASLCSLGWGGRAQAPEGHDNKVFQETYLEQTLIKIRSRRINWMLLGTAHSSLSKF